MEDGVPGTTCWSHRWHNLEEKKQRQMLLTQISWEVVLCSVKNHNPFLKHIWDNTNCRNTVDGGLKFILFLSWENRIAHKLSWNTTSHKLSDSLERAFNLIQYPVPGNIYCQMLQNTQASIFSTKMTCFVVMLASKIFSNFSNTFKTCQTSLSSNASKTILLGRIMLLHIACPEMAFLHSSHTTL